MVGRVGPGVLLAAALGGCTGAPPTAPPLTPELAAERVTFGTLQGIGSFVYQTSTRDERVSAGRSVVRESALSLKWKDPDHWEYQSVHDGKPATHWLVSDARAFEALSGDALRPKGDPEPLRAQLALGWDAWEDIVAATAGRVALGPGTDDTVNLRPAIRHELSLVPLPDTRRHPTRALGEALEPTSVTGTVWIDKATSVRVLADVTVESRTPETWIVAPDGTSAPSGTAPERTRTLSVKLAVTGLGEDPGVAAPPVVAPADATLSPSPTLATH